MTDPKETFETTQIVIGALLALSELLALTNLKSNSIFQLVTNVLKMFSFGPQPEGGERR